MLQAIPIKLIDCIPQTNPTIERYSKSKTDYSLKGKRGAALGPVVFN